MICDRVGILVKGRLRAVGAVHELVGTSAVKSVEVVVEGIAPTGVQGVERLGGKVMKRGDQVLIRLDDDAQVNAVLDLIRQHRGRLISLVPHKRSLEDLFLKEVGGSRA